MLSCITSRRRLFWQPDDLDRHLACRGFTEEFQVDSSTTGTIGECYFDHECVAQDTTKLER